MPLIKKTKKKINAAILIIGNEVLSGRTQDANVSFISNWLNIKCGINVEEVRIIPDIKNKIIFNVLNLSKKFDYVFTTGGIGPTHDDITALSISKAFKVKYEYNKEAYKILENYYGKKNFNEGRKKMSRMPSGSLLIYNPSSAAPGFKIKNVICLPGVPSILKSMINNVEIFLKKGLVTISRTLTLKTVESFISLDLERVQNKYLKKVDIGSYPFFKFGKVGVAIVLRSKNKKQLSSCEKNLIQIIKKKKIKYFLNK
jgi:molybdenum cofactor synthesis domain-containing protein